MVVRMLWGFESVFGTLSDLPLVPCSGESWIRYSRVPPLWAVCQKGSHGRGIPRPDIGIGRSTCSSMPLWCHNNTKLLQSCILNSAMQYPSTLCLSAWSVCFCDGLPKRGAKLILIYTGQKQEIYKHKSGPGCHLLWKEMDPHANIRNIAFYYITWTDFGVIDDLIYQYLSFTDILVCMVEQTKHGYLVPGIPTSDAVRFLRDYIWKNLI